MKEDSDTFEDFDDDIPFELKDDAVIHVPDDSNLEDGTIIIPLEEDIIYPGFPPNFDELCPDLTAIIYKDFSRGHQIGLIQRRLFVKGGGTVSRVDPRVKPNAMWKYFSKSESCEQFYKKTIKDCQKSGWKVVFQGKRINGPKY